VDRVCRLPATDPGSFGERLDEPAPIQATTEESR
jgi:hypothetical protein